MISDETAYRRYLDGEEKAADLLVEKYGDPLTLYINCCGVSERASDSLRGHWYAPCSRRLYSRM